MAVGIPLGPYRLVRRLASGGMAEIFLARQENKDGFARDLVVKRILPHLAADPEFRRMFRDEARLAALLSHPNVVHVYDFGSEPEADGETLWLAMELVRGVDLRALIARAAEQARTTGRAYAVPPHHAAKIASFVCEALAHAHALRVDGRPAGVVHRDVTPSNVLVSFDGAVKLADFGIAKARTGSRVREATEHGVVKGKLAYLSPEQARGEALDARSDLYNVGILLFESLLGEPLVPPDLLGVDGGRAARLLSARGEIPEPQRLERLPPALGPIVRRALAPRREDRHPDALSLRAELELFLRNAAEPSDAVEIGRFVRYLFPDALEEDARAPRAAGTVQATFATGFGRPPSPGTRPLVAGATRPLAGIGPTTLGQTTKAAAPGSASSTAWTSVLPARPPRAEPSDAASPAPTPPTTDTAAPAPALARAGTRGPRVSRVVLATAAVVLAVAGVVASVTTRRDVPPEPPPSPPVVPLAGDEPTSVAPAPAQLRVVTEPLGATVLVDGDELGVAPVLRRLAPGAHRVEARGDRGVVLAVENVTLSAGEVRELVLSIPRAAELATLRIDTSPSGARVRLDGSEAGTTPALAQVPPGRHRVDVELDGYAPAWNEIDLARPGEQAMLAFTLTRASRPAGGRTRRSDRSPAATGALTIATTPWSEVYLGSRHLGTTPLANVPLAAGTHTLTLRAPGRPPQRTTVTIRPGETTRVRLVL